MKHTKTHKEGNNVVSPFLSTKLCNVFGRVNCFNSFFPQDLYGNGETDDESSTSNDDGSPASDMENVQNDVVVKLEEITDWDENNPQTAESPSTDGPTVSSDLEDVQNVVVKIEEVAEWEDNSSPQNTSMDSPISDSDVKNVEVKMEEISDLDEYNQQEY